MRWAIKHKSGRTLFVTSDEFIASNRRKMGWIVEEVSMTSREQFEQWLYQQRVRGITFSAIDKFDVDGEVYYKSPDIQGQWNAWQASRAAIHIQACQCPNDHGPNVDDHYREQINNAGLKVKK